MLWKIKTVEMGGRIRNAQGDGKRRRTEILGRFTFNLIEAVTFEKKFEGGEEVRYIDV